MLEKIVLVDGIKVNYKQAGEGKPLLILHGWGSSSDSWVKIQELIAQHGYQVIVPDLPGFGRTQAPNEVWGVEEYADFVKQFTEMMGLGKFILVGHSFGGQVAVQFAVEYPEKLEKLILVAPAAIRHKASFSKVVLKYVAKAFSVLLYLLPFEDLRNNIKNTMYMIIRRRDYIKTQGIMRDVFKKVITQDLTAKFSKIQARTLIIWGERDQLTPLGDAYILKENIPNSKLEIIPQQGHNLHFKIPEKLSEYILNFILHQQATTATADTPRGGSESRGGGS